MPELVVRDVDEEVVAELKRQAAAHGRSVEAEHHAILRSHLLQPHLKKRSFGEVLAAMPDFGDGDLFDMR